MAVITISREFASGGDEVASKLCDVLGYHSFGKAEILQVVQETTFSRVNAVDYSEDNHEIQTFIDRLMGQKATPVQKIAWTEDPSIATRPERADVHEAAVLSLVKRAVKASLPAGNIVIVGRGGQVLLKDAPGVIHVRIEAPFETRFQRVIDQLKQEQDTQPSEDEIRRKAGDLIANRDISSADYIQRYYNVDWADSRLYHMVLNLGRLTVEQAVQMIVMVVQSVEENTTAQTSP
ncbi:MAG: cytidylate kinase-like family protein [Chloroflexi bacterium]|nr:MAG: cytidylate kinase-like family protein [Chloroflexota bacterium]